MYLLVVFCYRSDFVIYLLGTYYSLLRLKGKGIASDAWAGI